MTRTWVVVVLAAGCRTTAAPPRPHVDATRPPPVTEERCAAASDAARAAWAAGAPVVDEGEDGEPYDPYGTLACLGFRRRGEQLVFVLGVESPWSAIVGPAGDVRWWVGEGDPELDGNRQRTEEEATDLDGDGDDELLYTEETGEGGYSMRGLVVAWFDGRALQEDREIALDGGMEEGEATTCWSTWGTVPGPGGERWIEVTTTSDGPGPCEPGTTRYAWRQGQATQVP